METKLIQLSEALLEQVSKDGMSMLLGGGFGDINEHVNAGNNCNEINHGSACDVINVGANCSAINENVSCAAINERVACHIIRTLK